MPRCSEAGEQPTRESTNVDDAIEMSFPASDPPSWGGGIARVSPSEAPRHQSGGLEHLLQRIRAEYREMPGLSLTLRQAQRLWRLERRTCEALFRALTDARFLHRTDRGRFVLRQSLV